MFWYFIISFGLFVSPHIQRRQFNTVHSYQYTVKCIHLINKQLKSSHMCAWNTIWLNEGLWLTGVQKKLVCCRGDWNLNSVSAVFPTDSWLTGSSACNTRRLTFMDSLLPWQLKMKGTDVGGIKDNQLCFSARTSVSQGDERGTHGVWGN